MRIGIMGAMPEEVESILTHMSRVETVEHGSRQYHIGKLGAHDVVLVFSRWGKVAASSTATSLITEFKIDQLVFTGVAGATSPQLNIGDVVVSRQLYQHDMDARPLMSQHEIPLTGTTFFNANSVLMSAAQLATRGLFATLSKKVDKADLEAFQITNPKCVVGTIASGDQFIGNTIQTNAIMSVKPETCAVEMEGAAIAQVCHDYSVPFVVIRTISDKADHQAAIDFPRFINKIARHYAEHIVTGMFAEQDDAAAQDETVSVGVLA